MTKKALHSRRDFLKTSSVSLLTLAMPESVAALFPFEEKVRIGLISDLHVDIIHDGRARLQFFLDHMEAEKPNAIIQMGDFAIPRSENEAVIQSFNDSPFPAFHVLGNHDMDGGYDRATVAQAYGMPGFYYPKDLGPIQLIVLDGNDPGSPTKKGGYDSYIGPAQQTWLSETLESASKPVLLVSHQPIAGIYPIDNSLEIQAILSRFASKILLAINGHAHVDQHLEVGGVQYLHINSASYYWVGEKLAHESLSPAIHQKFPELQFTCPYLAPLFALLSIDPKARKITIQGRKTEWIGPSPLTLGYSILNETEQGDYLQPQISSRKF